MISYSYQRLVNEYNQASTVQFSSLDYGVRTSIFSLYYQYGCSVTRIEHYWNLVTRQKWKDAIWALRNYEDFYAYRRNNEAFIMAAALQNCSEGGYADICFVVDESESISSSDFTLVKNFLYNYVNSVEVGREKYQFSIVEFSTEAKLSAKFSTYPQKEQLKQFILNMRQMRQNTSTGKALKLVSESVFAEGSGARSLSAYKRIVIVLTDGQSSDPNDVYRYSSRLREQQVVTYSVGVGPFVNSTELFIIAGDQSRIYTTYDFNELLSITSSVKKSSCLSPVPIVSETTATNTTTTKTVVTNLNVDTYKYFSFSVRNTNEISIFVNDLIGKTIVYGSYSYKTPYELIYDFKSEGINKVMRMPVPVRRVERRYLQDETNVTAYFCVKGEEPNSSAEVIIVNEIICSDGRMNVDYNGYSDTLILCSTLLLPILAYPLIKCFWIK